jgi:hypothetical protein
MVIVLGLAACAEASTVAAPTSASVVLEPVSAELAGLVFEVHQEPG